MPPVTTRLRYELDDTGIKRAINGMNQLSQTTAKTGSSFNLLARGSAIEFVAMAYAVRSASQAMIAAMAGPVQAAIEFESAFTRIRKTVDASDAGFAVLEKDFRALAKVSPAPIDQLLRIGELGGQLGIAQSNLIGFTETVTKLAAATNLTAESGALFLGRFTAIMGLRPDSFERIGSAMAQLADNTASSEAEISEFALRIAGAGKAVGLSAADVLGLSAALASVGLDAESGGTAVSRALIQMSDAVAKGDDRLRLFALVSGQTTAAFKRQFETDAAGALQTFISGLDNLHDAGINIFPVLEALELGEIRVRDALLRASSAQELFGSTLATSRDAYDKATRLTEEYNRQLETAEAKIQIAKNNLHDLSIELGNIFLPAVGNAALGWTAFLRALSDTGPFATVRTMLDSIADHPLLRGAISAVSPGLGILISGREAFGRSSSEVQRQRDLTTKWISDQEEASLSAEEALKRFGNAIADAGEQAGKTDPEMDRLRREIDALLASMDAGTKKAKTFEDMLREAGTSLAEIGTAWAESHPAVQMFTLRITGLNDQLAAVNAAIEENARQQRYMQAEIAATQARISSLTDALAKARDRLREFTAPRLVGQGAIEERIFQLEAVLRRMRIAEFTAGAGAAPQLTSAMRAALGGIALDQPSIERALDSLRTRLEDLTADPLRKLKEAAEGTSKELTFEEALAGIAATKSQIIGLEAALASENETLRAQQQALADMAAAAEAMRESAARLTAQIQQAEAQQRMMNDALQMAFKWFGEDRQKMIELGGESEKQAYIIDEKMRAMLMAINAYATGGTSTTLQEVQRLINEAIAFAAQNPIIIYTQLGGELPGGRAAGGGGGGQHGFAVTAGGETQTFGTQGAAEQYYNQQTGGAPFTDDQFVAAFQHGGIVTRPTLGIVGEAGPEAVIPLGQAAMGNITININAQAFMGSRSEARKFAEEIAELLNERQRLRLPTGGI